MIYFHKCTLCCVILLIILGCSNQSNSEKKNIRNKSANIASYDLQAENTSKFIHCFGVKLKGKYEDIVTKYYGVPDISDENEDSYHWYLPSGLCVRARHLHAPDGGWTVFFHY